MNVYAKQDNTSTLVNVTNAILKRSVRVKSKWFELYPTKVTTLILSKIHMFCTSVCPEDVLEETKILAMTITQVSYVGCAEGTFSKPIRDA